MNTYIIAYDAKTIIYTINSMVPELPKKNDKLYKDKITLVKILFYQSIIKVIPQNVEKECLKTANAAQLRKFHGWVNYHPFPRGNGTTIEKRKSFFLEYHDDINDCLNLAEAEAAGAHYFLTCDKELTRKLSHVSTITQICRPSEFATLIDVSRVGRPDLIPHPTSIMRDVTWWKEPIKEC